VRRGFRFRARITHRASRARAPLAITPHHPMPQTALALFALVIVATFALNQRELTTQAQLNMMRNEIAVISTGVANEIFDDLGALPFDAQPQAASPSDLTPPDRFGAAEDWESVAILDQVHGHTTVARVATEHGTLELDVRAQVRYVQKLGEEFVESEMPTYLKEVTLTIDGPLGTRAEVGRVYSLFDAPAGS
jgi:hypothetical protein